MGSANLVRSESEKRAKSAVATAAGDGKLGRSKSVKVHPKSSPTPTPPPDTKLPTFSALHLVNENEDCSDKETSTLQNGEEPCSVVQDTEKYASLMIINLLLLIFKHT